MNNRFYFVLIAFAMASAIPVIRKTQAQGTGTGSVDTTDGMMANGAETETNKQETTPILVTRIPPGYRDWRLVSVAHEAGKLNDIRAILGNELAINAYREGKLPFPEGTIIARIAWLCVPSEENNRIFGRAQSFVPGAAPSWYLQFMVKDPRKYASTGGWGYGQFDGNGTPAAASMMTGCYPCHQAVKSRDFAFTHYAP